MNSDVEESESSLRATDAQDQEELERIGQRFFWFNKSLPLQYESFAQLSLPSPSLTVQILPGLLNLGNHMCGVRLLLGSQKSGQGTDYVKILRLTIPHGEHFDLTAAWTTIEQEEFVQSRCWMAKHQGDVDRARLMPQQPADVFATSSVGNGISVYAVSGNEVDVDVDDSSHVPGIEGPAARLANKKADVGLAWSPHQEGMLLNCCADGSIKQYQVDAGSIMDSIQGGSRGLAVSASYKGHSGVVTDVCFSPSASHPCEFVSCGQDGKVLKWDSRQPSSPAMRGVACRYGVNGVTINTEHEVAVACEDGQITTYDIRSSLSNSLRTLQGHRCPVNQVAWHPSQASWLVSSDQDHRIFLWNLNRTQPVPEGAQSVPQIVMVHAGHCGTINDVTWCEGDGMPSWMLASVSSDGDWMFQGQQELQHSVVQVWQPAADLLQAG